MSKYVIFAFNGDAMCFAHVMLNALDLNSRGNDVRIVIEGEAVKLIKEMEESSDPLYKKIRDKRLIDGICKACSAQMGVLEYNQKTGIPMKDDMNGHPSFLSYIGAGYLLITM